VTQCLSPDRTKCIGFVKAIIIKLVFMVNIFGLFLELARNFLLKELIELTLKKAYPLNKQKLNEG